MEFLSELATCMPLVDVAEQETIIHWTVACWRCHRVVNFSGFLNKLSDPLNFGIHFNEVEANNCTKADMLILNTREGLDQLASVETPKS
jgi:hypothetical protein